MRDRVVAGWCVGLLLATTALATQVRHFRIQGREALLGGKAEGVSVDSVGALRLARRAHRVAALSEPFLLSAARHPEGWVLGTGNDGRVLLLDESGNITELFQTEEPEVFAVWVDAQGVVFAGSSPSGRVYRFENGVAESFFEPEELYIWALAGGHGGKLLIATGTEGRLYQVGPEGDGQVLWDSEDTHIRSLLVQPDAGVVAGTAGDGLVARIGLDGGVSVLYNADQPEIVGLASGDDGLLYAAAVASEASSLPPAEDRSRRDGEEESEGEAIVTVTVADANGTSVGSRPAGYKGPRSEIVVVGPDDSTESLWQSENETVFSLAWSDGSLWAGTGLEGALYRLENGQMVVEKDLDEKQIVALVPQDNGVAVGTTNGAAFYRIGEELEHRGQYTGPPMDARSRSLFGSLRWRGSAPENTGVQFSARSGNTADPDETWSEWTASLSHGQIQLNDLAPGRFVQWRAELEGDGSSTPEISSVELAYRQENQPPRIESLEVLEPGQILVPSSFNPSNQVYEPAHPNRDGIFTTLEPEKSPENHLKTLWKLGYRTLRWKASDPNGDELLFSLELRREGSSSWVPVAEGLEETRYSFDATVLPDGLYRFRLSASDEVNNPPDRMRSVNETSLPMLVDHSAPRLVSVTREGATMRVHVRDDWNALREASLSLDADPWEDAPLEDGILDGPSEVLVVEVPPESSLVLLRLVDAAFNTVTFDLLREAP